MKAAQIVYAGISGLIGSAAMFLVLALGIYVMHAAPINMPLASAFFYRLGFTDGVNVLPIAVHFAYGAFWSMMLLYLSEEKVGVKAGNVMALVLWLFLMVFYGPIIGWGLFGIGAVNGMIPAEDPLYLSSGPAYVLFTLLAHLAYGTVMGWMNQKFLAEPSAVERLDHLPAEEERRPLAA